MDKQYVLKNDSTGLELTLYNHLPSAINDLKHLTKVCKGYRFNVYEVITTRKLKGVTS